MSDIQLLIDTTNNLCETLDKISKEEKRFCADIQMRLEQMSWEIYRMSNDLQYISDFR